MFITTDGLPRIGGDNRDFSIAVAGEVMQMDNGIFFKEDEAQKQTSWVQQIGTLLQHIPYLERKNCTTGYRAESVCGYMYVWIEK